MAEDIVHPHLPNEAQRQALWQVLERAPGGAALTSTLPSASERRKTLRLAYPRTDITVQFTHPGGGGIARTVAARTLSEGGICFLLPNFVHVGTACEVTLRRRASAGEQVVAGKVAWCRHIAGLYHGVGVSFNEPILPKLFVESSEWERAQLLEDVVPAQLKGSLLFLDDQEMDRALFVHLLKPTKIEVTAVGDLEAALAAVAKQNFQAAVIDLHLGTGKATGEQALERLRAKGFNGGVIAISADNNPNRVEALNRAGVGLFISKPYDAKRLYAALAAALRNGKAQAAEEPVYSEFAGQEAYAELIERYVKHAHEIAEALAKLIAAEKFDEARTVCWAIRGSAAGYGFRTVTELANEAVRAMDAGGSVKEARQELLRLQSECRRVTARKAL
jgi:CheY-like chemotaxis protein/HPt (histidine-containing phosphotransfer) domain-containing protein